MRKENLFDPASTTLYREDYRPSEYTIKKTELKIDLDEEQTLVHARLNVSKNPAIGNSPAGPLVLDGQNMKLKTLRIVENGKQPRDLDPAEYLVTDKHLILKNPPKKAFTLETVTEINPKANTQLEGIYMAGDMLCSQCEARGFRNITYFLDRPDVLSTFSVTLEGDKKKFPILLSNGNGQPHKTTDLGNGRHSITWNDPWPKPSYLFAVVAGDLKMLEDSYTTKSGKKVDLRIFVQPGYEDKIDWAMESVKRAMKWDEEKYGREYDLDCFHVVGAEKFNMGAMENKGLNVFNISCLIGDPDTVTDNELIRIEGIIGHEYFHNWSGNRVTLRDWFELTLKEGLTVLRDREFTADMHSAPIKTINDARGLRSIQFMEDAGPTAHPIRPEMVEVFDNIYTNTVYRKGSYVLRMLQTVIGDDAWYRGMNEYFDTFDGQAVTCDDFVDTMEKASGHDLSQFRRWYSQSGTPEISYEGSYNAKEKTYTLTLRQHTPETADQTENEKQPLHIPVAVGLIGQSGKDVPLNENGDTTQVLHLTEPEQTFTFRNVSGPVVPSVLRGFTAPVKMVTQPSDDDLAFRMAHDSDSFNRYEAAERFAVQTLVQLTRDAVVGKDLVVPQAFLDAYRANLQSATDGDTGFSALLLSLPPVSLQMQGMEQIDPEAIHKARSFLTKTLAEQFTDDYTRIYAETQAPENETYSVDSSQVGRRALHNMALGYLGKLKTPDIVEQAEEHYIIATNMTERLSGLATLTRIGLDKASEALDDFYLRYGTFPSAAESWLSLQASAPVDGAIDRVRTLMSHEAFDITNPNRVRALIGGFIGNMTQFHKADGTGYKLLADIIIKMNDINPQMGAGLVKSLARWKKYRPDLGEKMHAELQRIAETPKLAANIGEIVRKAIVEKPASTAKNDFARTQPKK